jgi:hypothetical protein
MIIWKGLGFLGALILVIAIVTANSIGEDLQGWAFLISAVPVWLLGRYFYKRPAEMMIDPKSQQQIMVKPDHDLFWVELDYWAIIFAIFGIAFLLPETGFNTNIALILAAIIYFGRLGFGLYEKYIKKDRSENNPLPNNSTAPAIVTSKEDKLSRFAAKSKDKKKLNQKKSSIDETNKEQGLPAAELKKKAFYAQMRKDRAAPKKFKESNHKDYFPSNSMPFIPTKSILNKDTVFEEE